MKTLAISASRALFTLISCVMIVSCTQKKNENPTPCHLFSVSKTHQVSFASGNLDTTGLSMTSHQYDPGKKYVWSTNMSSNKDDSLSCFKDWGNNLEGNWRTLTKEEWAYLLTRESRSYFVYVNGGLGLLLLPDDWNPPTDYQFSSLQFHIKRIKQKEWDEMEEYGAVFLPWVITNEFGDGGYWTSSADNDGNAFVVLFENRNKYTPTTMDGEGIPPYNEWRLVSVPYNNDFSVRLVQDN